MPSMFKGSSGKVSMMRVMSFFVSVSIILVFIAHNIISMLTGGGFVSMGSTEAMLIAGVLGAKAAQNFSEKKVDNSITPDESVATEPKAE
jgi:hypothetical protein